jgi:integrase
VRGKGSKERLVPVAPPLLRRLERYQRSRPPDARGDQVFLAARRNGLGEYAPLTTSGVLQLLRGAADRAGPAGESTRISCATLSPPRRSAGA